MNEEKIILELYVKDFKTFSRKSGNTGQEIVVKNFDNYSCHVKCVDKEIKDLSSIPIGKKVRLVMSPDFTLIKGEKFFQNVITLVVNDFELTIN